MTDADTIDEPEVRATCNVAQRMHDTNAERGTEYRMDPGLAAASLSWALAALDAERAAHEETRRERDVLHDMVGRDDADAWRTRAEEAIRQRDEARDALADVSRRCGGYRDSRVDGDGGIVAVVVRERDEAQAALVALREACRPALRVLDKLDVDEWDAFDTAVAATPAALAGQTRARALREAAKAYDAAALNAGRTTVPGDWLRARADEEEKTR